jgi:hypothetical protein
MTHEEKQQILDFIEIRKYEVDNFNMAVDTKELIDFLNSLSTTTTDQEVLHDGDWCEIETEEQAMELYEAENHPEYFKSGSVWIRGAVFSKFIFYSDHTLFVDPESDEDKITQLPYETLLERAKNTFKRQP